MVYPPSSSAFPPLLCSSATGSLCWVQMSKGEGVLDLGRPAGELHNRVRAFAGWPGTTARLWLEGVPREELAPFACAKAAPAIYHTDGHCLDCVELHTAKISEHGECLHETIQLSSLLRCDAGAADVKCCVCSGSVLYCGLLCRREGGITCRLQPEGAVSLSSTL